MGAIETRFAEIIWDREPITASALAKISEEELGWKKTTSYTVLKRLCDKGIFKNEKGTVSAVISKSNYYAMQSEKFVDQTFNGSLPAFLAAFTSRKTLTKKEIDELRKMITEYGEK